MNHVYLLQHPLVRCCNEAARSSVGRAARGHLVRTHRPPLPSQAPRPPGRRGRAAVATNLGKKESNLLTIPICHYYSLVSAASSVAWPRRLLRFLRLASVATCRIGAVSTVRPLARQLIRPGTVSAHRAGPVTTLSCGGRIIWSLLRPTE